MSKASELRENKLRSALSGRFMPSEAAELIALLTRERDELRAELDRAKAGYEITAEAYLAAAKRANHE